MRNNIDGCLICASPIEYFDNTMDVECSICGETFQANALCKKGHFVCDACHMKKGFEDIKAFALLSASKNPIEIADEMMRMNSIHMHGPEHHFLVAAALLTAYFNQLQSDDYAEKNPCNFNDSRDTLSDIIFKAEQRASGVPGGICGFWGSCGAAIGTGIFMSIITDASPLTVESWSKANMMVSNALYVISENGGPRCCKRNTYLAITSAVEYLKKNMEIHLEQPNAIECDFFERNNECKQNECKYFKRV